MIALIMFALITSATSLALTAGIRGQESVRRRAQDLQEVRAVLSVLTRDFRAAFAATGNPNNLFVATGTDNGQLVVFTTASQRIQPDTDETGQQMSLSPPQSDVAVVRYSFNPDTGELSRAVWWHNLRFAR